MYLNEKIAVEIIKEISPYIQYDLNIMDSRGQILASTNIERIGTVHEGAQILIDSGNPLLIVENDHSYRGCKTGVNLPIYYAGHIIGVVGITGDPKETIKYAQILKKMTEMIIYENFDASQKNMKENANLLYMNDLIHGNIEGSLFNLEEWLLDSGVNIKGPFTVSIFKIKEEIFDKDHGDDLKKAREAIIKNQLISALKLKSVLCVSNGEYFIALANCRPSVLSITMDDLNGYLKENYKCEFLCTIGNEYTDLLDIPKSYNEALIINRRFGGLDSGVYCFSDIVLEFVLNQIPQIYKKNLFEQVFKNCTPEEVQEIKTFIAAYFDCNGSLVKLAEKNYIHKNTVQYKINKIHRATGRDPRDFNDLFILYLACIA